MIRPGSDRRPTIEGFDVEAELGRGAMGVVYRARQRSTGRSVALKVMGSRVSAKGTDRERFHREGEVMAGLRHPGILTIHAAGFEGDTPWLACELIEGARPLDEAAAGQPLRRKVELVRDVARALGHAHRCGVVHRDVKPANVLVDAAGQVHVADFGMALAEDLARLTATGHSVGTPAYMSPEQLTGERAQLGPHTDVWAAGVILYELLTGGPPYKVASIQELVWAISAGAPSPPSDHAPDVPPELDTIVVATLATDPAGRPVDGDALAAELDAWLSGAGVRPGARTSRRRRSALAVVALLALGGLFVPLRAALERKGEMAALAGALEWDGAACATSARSCAGGPHRLAAWALGDGPGAPPDRTDLAERIATLGALEPRLDDPAERARAADLRLRLVAHERLLGAPRPAAATPTDLLVTAFVLAGDEAADPDAVVAALVSASVVEPVPGGLPLLARALDRGLQAERPLPPGAVARLLASVPAAARAALVERVRPWVTRRALAARDGLVAGSLEALWALGPLLELAAAVNAPAPPPLVVGPPPRPEDDEPDYASAVPVDASRLWLEVARALKARPAGEVVAALASTVERAGPGSSAPVLRALRQASAGAIEREEPDALLALRFDAEASRLDPGGSRALARGGVERALRQRVRESGPGGAEALAALARLELRSPEPVWPSKLHEEPLRRLVEARPWSRAARAARLREPSPGEQGLDLLEVLEAPTDDLSDGAHEGLLRRLGGLAMGAAVSSVTLPTARLASAAWGEACRRPLPAARWTSGVGALVAALGARGAALVAEGRARDGVPALDDAPPAWLPSRTWRLVVGQAWIAMGRRLVAKDDAGAVRLLRAGIARLTAEEGGVEQLDTYEELEFADVLLAQCLYRLGDYAGVLATLERPGTQLARRRSASFVATMTVALIQLNRHEEALPLIDEVTAYWLTQDQADPQTIEVLRSLDRSRGRVRVNPKR